MARDYLDQSQNPSQRSATPSVKGEHFGLTPEQDAVVTQTLWRLYQDRSDIPARAKSSNVRYDGTTDTTIFNAGIHIPHGSVAQIPVPTKETRDHEKAWAEIVNVFQETGASSKLCDVKDFLEGTDWRSILSSTIPAELLHYIGGDPTKPEDLVMPGCFCAVNFNNVCRTHFDTQNHDWCLMTAHGWFLRGELILQMDNGTEYLGPIWPGDTVAGLMHCIRHRSSAFEGKFRGTVVWTVKKQLRDLRNKHPLPPLGVAPCSQRPLPLGRQCGKASRGQRWMKNTSSSLNA
ncbi:uncharacterized protein EV422DRAFT_511601 [Fimicolochytrium jonesii]|uniref:uncharacterized protein n=1 Tax=Fimicolochytrium jonesii TaxID=1396493 RepID=UPI0022FE1F1C|nr:uncharacterized protein EV422DRAFT_511601 [Fimicolochytrium jonesii]KAI8826834.1 hypothetical protein EV422DRAFT_511601 [Fimicolochytrium jonesii]